MPIGELLNIDVLASDINECKKFLGSVVSSVVRSHNVINDNEVIVSMCEKGKELLSGAERYEESLKSSRRVDEYSLVKAIEEPESVNDVMELSFRCKDTYCGRIGFNCCTADNYTASEHTDVVLFILDKDSKNVENIAISSDVVFMVAVYVEDLSYDVELKFKNYRFSQKNFIIDLENFSCFPYNPYGIYNGKVNSIDNAEPYGVEGIFWSIVKSGVLKGINYHNNVVNSSLKMIRNRRSIFQRKSKRRKLELDTARKEYSISIASLYGMKNLEKMVNGVL